MSSTISFAGGRDRGPETLRRENERLRGYLSLLSQLSRRITSSLDLPTVLQDVVDAACVLTEARYGALGVFDDSGHIQQFITSGVTPEEKQRIGGLPQGQGILGFLRALDQPLRLADLSQHAQSVGFPPNHPPMKTFLGTPIRYADEVLGNLYLAEKAGGEEFSAEDEYLLVLFAGQAAMAIHNAQLFQRELGAKAETERTARTVADAAREALWDSQQLLQGIMNNTAAVVYAKDLQGRYIFVNRQYETLFHWSKEGVTGKTDYDIFPKEAADAFRTNDQKVLAAGTPIQVEETVLHHDGPHTYISIKFPLPDSNGIPYAVCSISTDITERQRAQEAMERERTRLELLVNTSPVGVFVVDVASRRVTLANHEARRILGYAYRPDVFLNYYEQAVVYRRPDGRIYIPEELPLQRAMYRGEKVTAEEVRFEFPDGRSIPTLVSATPVLSSAGDIVEAIAIIQDITPLEELEKLRTEFLGMVSHELKTPLTAIKGSAAIALGSSQPLEPEEARELFEVIDEQSDRLRDLVNNLLDMTRIEAGTLSIGAEPTDLQAILEEAQTGFIHSGNSQKLSIEMPPGLPAVHADRRRIVQVLSNLLNNAAKFSPATSAITVSAEHDESYVTVRVQDRGRGIPMEKLPYLFQKFSQVHEDSEGKLGGSGLGLAICKGIIEAHGGRIWAESAGEGRGSTFSFTLPVATNTVSRPSLPDTALRASHLGKVSHSGERTRILAVDDEPQVLRYLRRCLGEAGY